MENNDAKKQRRFTFTLCPEAQQCILLEQTRRRHLGHPHDKLIDVVNDWLLEAGQRRNHMLPDAKPSAENVRALLRGYIDAYRGKRTKG